MRVADLAIVEYGVFAIFNMEPIAEQYRLVYLVSRVGWRRQKESGIR